MVRLMPLFGETGIMAESEIRLPTDFRILELMAQGKRQTSTNLAAMLDLDRRYVTNRLNFLREEGYLRDPGPAEQSRMVEITAMGRIAIFRGDRLVREQYSMFRHLCHHVFACNRKLEDQFLPDLIATRHHENRALQKLSEIDGLTIPSEFENQLNLEDHAYSTSSDVLYSLYFWSLAERKDNMDVYQISPRGEKYLELLPESAFESESFEVGVDDWIEATEYVREYYTDEEIALLEEITKCWNVEYPLTLD